MKKCDKLRAFWSRSDGDLTFYAPTGYGTVSDSRFLASALSKEFIDELRDRGYNPETLRFEICPSNGNDKFRSERK